MGLDVALGELLGLIEALGVVLATGILDGFGLDCVVVVVVVVAILFVSPVVGALDAVGKGIKDDDGVIFSG